MTDPRALAIAVGLALVLGAGGAWYVQGLRWDNDVAARQFKADKAIIDQQAEVSAKLVKSQTDTEAMRLTFIDYKKGAQNEIDRLGRAVAGGTVGLHVAATCSNGLQSGATATSGTDSGAPELTASARQDYYALRQGIADQYAALMLCRNVLAHRPQ